MGKVGKWLLNIAIAVDQLGNAITGHDPQETISSRLGKIKRKHGGRIPKRYPLKRMIDAGLDLIDPNHSIDAIMDDEGSDAVMPLEGPPVRPRQTYGPNRRRRRLPGEIERLSHPPKDYRDVKHGRDKI